MTTPAGAGLAQLDGYPLPVRHSAGAAPRARAMADLVTAAYSDLCVRLGGIEPRIALIVADAGDWPGTSAPYGLAYFNDAAGQLAPGILVMPAGRGPLWDAMVGEVAAASPRGHRRLRAAYPDGAGGVDLGPFFDLVAVHELGHAFEVLGDLRLPTLWLGEVFVNLALHVLVATRMPERLAILETLPAVGAGSRRIAARWRAEGDCTLEQLDAHYTGGATPMDPLNYVWYQYRWMRLAARVYDADGDAALVRFWECFHGRDRVDPEAGPAARTAKALAPLLTREVSPTLGRAVRAWR